MIIQCRQCATKFRFKDEQMTGDGVRVRCGRCGHEFFEPNPRPQAPVRPAEEEIPPAAKEETFVFSPRPAAKAPAEEPETEPLPEKPLTPADVVTSQAAGPEAEEEPEVEDEEMEEEPPRAPFWTTGRLVAYSILVFIVVGSVYLWLNPAITRDVLNVVSPGSADKILGPAPKAASVAVPGGINFAEVKERFTKSTTSGDLLVISGLAVNEYDYPVARVKLRCRILDSAGKPLGEIEAYGGNLLTDDELNRLTDKEIAAELQRPEGSDMPNTGIRPRASIPFMLVFMNPSKEVDEYIIELTGVERAPTSN